MPAPKTSVDKALLQFGNPDAWDAVEENIPIFVSHDFYRKPLQTPDGKVAYAEVALPRGEKPTGTGWEFIYSVTDDHLKEVAKQINKVYQEQDTPVIWKRGHTDVKNLGNQAAQPAPTAFGVKASVGRLPGGRMAVLQEKLYHSKGCYQENKTYPHRSVEFDPTTLAISDVAYLRTKPKLNMGAQVYGDALPWQQLYAEAGNGSAAIVHDADWVSYGFDLPPVAVPVQYEDVPPSANGAPGGNPASPPTADGPDDGKKKMFMQLIQSCLPELKQLLGVGAQPPAPPMPPPPPPPPAAPPMPHPPAPPAPTHPPAPQLAPAGHPPAPQPMPPRPGVAHMAADQVTLEIIAEQNRKMQAELAALQAQYGVTVANLKTQEEKFRADKAAQNVAQLWREGYEAFNDENRRKTEIAYQATLSDVQLAARTAEIRDTWRVDTSRSQGDPTNVPTIPVLPGAVNHNPDSREFGYSPEDTKHADHYMQSHPNCEWDDAMRFALEKRGVK